MPYMVHPQIESPADEIVIWRYMDLPKLLLMLEQRSLYFAVFSEFEDKWEAVLDRELTASIANQFTAASAQVNDLYGEYLKHTAVNCWYCGEDESIAMWRLYTKSEYGVAIRSNVGDLKRALSVSKQDVYLGRVVYRDHTAPPSQVLTVNQITPYKAVLQKRVCYKHECEMRAITEFLPEFPENPALGEVFVVPFPQHGKPINVDLHILIHSITTGPNFPGWALGLLQSALSRAGINPPLAESSAFKSPEARFIVDQ
jgi:hypothetical protein